MLCSVMAELLIGCTSGSQDAVPTAQSRPIVQVAHVATGYVPKAVGVRGTILYLKRNQITSPIPGHIIQCLVGLGDHVRSGQVLYTIETKEHRALQGVRLRGDSTLVSNGVINVVSNAEGIISTIDRQFGDYVLEGAQLCVISKSSDMVLQVEVPFRYAGSLSQGQLFTVELPTGKHVQVRIRSSLPRIQVSSQTQPFLAEFTERIVLPEGLVVRLELTLGSNQYGQVLPTECIQSDELLSRYWVVCIVRDSIAVHIPVTIGNANETLTQILTPHFATNDVIVVHGAYGLEDSTTISIAP